MGAFSDTVFTAGLPSLVLPSPSGTGGMGRTSSEDPRPGLLDAHAVRSAVAAHLVNLGKRPSTETLRVLEGLSLLWHDHWGAAHAIAQDLEGEPDPDLLHAILHRREGDFANAGYWFRAVGNHPSYRLLERRIAASAEREPLIAILGNDPWSPAEFLSLVRKHRAGSGETARVLMRIQAEEFRAFADHLLRF